MIVWAAREKDGRLFLYRGKPVRNRKAGLWICDEEGILVGSLNGASFYDFPIKWEDEPIKLKIEIIGGES